MILQHNMMAINANRQLNITNHKKADATEKLSSGYRINRAADDAAGLAISEKMRRQIRGLHQASANIQDGIGYIQVADGALNEVHDILQRMNELSVKAANGTYNGIDRVFIDDEIQDLKEELDRIFETTSFNDRKIWDGNTGTKVQIGVESRQAVAITSSRQKIDITNDNCGVLAYEYYTINANDAGVHVSWLGYDGNNYQTETIDWDTLKANNYSFEMSDYFGTHDGNNKLYDNNGNPVFTHQISFSPVESAQKDDMIKCLNGITMSTSPNPSVYPDFGDINGNSFGSLAYDISMYGVFIKYEALYAAGIDFDITNDTFFEPADSTGKALPANSSKGNATHIPAATLSNDLNAAKTSTDTWTFQFYMAGIGTVTATSSYIEAVAITDSGGFQNLGKPNKYGDGTLGSLMSSLTSVTDPTSPGLLSPANGGSHNNGGTLSIHFTMTSQQNFTYAGSQTTNELGNINITLRVHPSDTEQDVFTRVNKLLNESTVLDGYIPNDTSVSAGINAPKANTHKIDVPIYQSTGGLIIQAGTEVEDQIPIIYDSLSVDYLGLENTNALTPDDCGNAINAIQDAMQLVSAQRSTFGAYQNRLEHAYNNNKNIEENTQYAESILRDTDMATTMVEYSNLDIIQQAGQAVLSQANTNPESVLQLLQEL